MVLRVVMLRCLFFSRQFSRHLSCAGGELVQKVHLFGEASYALGQRVEGFSCGVLGVVCSGGVFSYFFR